MTSCSDNNQPAPASCCSSATSASSGETTPCAWFANMIPNCLEYARAAKKQGRPIVGILCEYTPRELILAAGAVPVCLCGGSAATIPAAEKDLPANLCPLIKSTYGYHAMKNNPFLEMADLIVAETTCDGKKKMYELMGQSRPMYVLELPQKPDDADAFDHWRRELAKFKKELERRFSTSITDEQLRRAIVEMNRERQLRRRLAEFMEADAPPLTGRALLEFKSSISAIPADLAMYEKAIALLRNKQPDHGMGSRVRVLLTGVPIVHGAERVLEIIEGHGGLVVASDNCTGIKPIWEDVEETDSDPLAALAKKYFHLSCSVMTPNERRLELLRRLAERYRPRCMIELIWQACLTYAVEARRVQELAERELGIGYLRIETDYSPADSARIATRVEALMETCRERSGGGRR